MPPRSFAAAQAGIQAADHVAISAPELAAIREDLKRECPVAIDQIPGFAAVDAGAAGVAGGKVDDVAVARRIAGSRGLREAGFWLADLYCDWPCCFVYGCDGRDRGGEDPVSAGGLRILEGCGDREIEAREQV